jgi:hypothetical protein
MADIKVNRERVIGEVTRESKNTEQKIQVSIIDSSIGEYVAITDMYVDKDGHWKNGKGKWIPSNNAEDIGNLLLQAATAWENDEYEGDDDNE